ncbi:MAG TPA: hypothetical protein DDW76_25150 [Cyanobacteria bacterium UBA11369]|nr:hypothetical protein [Cyanobacteria bacterium UBA8553]HAZ49459.1 hypothetical protein [Cyanobacteria bacterium UBA11371]HBE31185.1 hypothetical protein [Cyanobacteria bacterium UBA11368]HBE51974.1 hypothetical protein [Cyanobacteria bacterium UBA11369]
MSNTDQQAIRAKLEQGINKNARHIFRNKPGHLSDDTPENRQLFVETVIEPNNYLGTDKYNTQWYAKTLTTGEQIWVQVRNGEIRNGGKNPLPKTWHPDTGLSSSTQPNYQNNS